MCTINKKNKQALHDSYFSATLVYKWLHDARLPIPLSNSDVASISLMVTSIPLLDGYTQCSSSSNELGRLHPSNPTLNHFFWHLRRPRLVILIDRFRHTGQSFSIPSHFPASIAVLASTRRSHHRLRSLGLFGCQTETDSDWLPCLGSKTSVSLVPFRARQKRQRST